MKKTQARITKSSLWVAARTLVYRDKILYAWVRGFPRTELSATTSMGYTDAETLQPRRRATATRTASSNSLSPQLDMGSAKSQSPPGFSIDLNFQDVVTSKLKKLDVSVQNLEVMQ